MPLRISSILLFFFCAVEIYSISSWLSTDNNEAVSIIYFMSGIAIVGLCLFRKADIDLGNSPIWYFLTFIAIIIGSFFSIYYGQQAIQSIELNYLFADMLPVIQIMNERFVSGEAIYSVIPEIHNGMTPIYLPAMWLPFLPSVLFDFDPRWIGIIAIISSFYLMFFSVRSYGRNVLTILWIFLVFLILKLTLVQDNRIISMTEEGIVIAYYTFLCFALWKRNTLLISLAICLCLFSRYALVFWVPVYLIYLVIQKEKLKAIKTAIYSGIISLLILLISRSFSQIPYFISLQSNYQDAISDPDLEWKYTPLIRESLGLAKFFEYENLSLLHLLLLICSLVAPFVFLFIYYKFKHRMNQIIFPLACLKLSLVVFYNLLTMPYIYLFFTSSFVSLAIFYVYINQDTAQLKLEQSR